ncbi:MAG: Holliday junction DNA helicase RuvB C-terminal domain-containing protein [Nanoarchaeota archaeon]
MGYFDSIIGQCAPKRALSFLLDGHAATGTTNNILIVSKRGTGKTMISREFAKNLKLNGRPKPFIEVNASEIKNISTFFTEIAIPFLGKDQPATIFLDEISECPKPLMSLMLSILAPNKENRNVVQHNGNSYEFNFYFVTFLFACVEAQKLSKPFQERLARIELEPYTPHDLTLILKQNAKEVDFENELAPKIVTTLRANPRFAVNAAKNIKLYCKSNNKRTFKHHDWESLKYKLNIRPFGLLSQEVQLLKYLADNKQGLTLTNISAKLGLPTSTVRNDVEQFLLGEDLIQIEVKRIITPKGLKVWKEIKDAQEIEKN